MATPTPEQIAALRANDHENLRGPLIAGHVVCIFVAFLSVILRFWARRIVKTFWGADDWTSATGMIITAVYTASNLAMIDIYHMGRHIWWVDDPASFVKLSLVAEIMYNAAIPFIKASILLLYRRIFPQRWLKWSLVGLGLFIIAYSVAQIIAEIFQCTPIDSLWGASPKKYCINFPLLAKVGGIINILTDVAILALPIWPLWNLNLSAARRRLLLVMFLIGGIACVASIVRLFYVDKIGNSTDASWDYAIPALIANVELCVGVLAANLPTYRPLITTCISSRRPTDTVRTSRANGSYLPVKDSLQVPMSSHFTNKGATNSEADDMEMLAGNPENKVQTHISNNGKYGVAFSNDDELWSGPQKNEIRVTTSLKTS